MASSSKASAGPPLQPGLGEELEAPPLVPAASTEAMVDDPMAPPPIPGESVPAAPSSVSGEAEDLREGFAAPLIDPCELIKSTIAPFDGELSRSTIAASSSFLAGLPLLSRFNGELAKFTMAALAFFLASLPLLTALDSELGKSTMGVFQWRLVLFNSGARLNHRGQHTLHTHGLNHKLSTRTLPSPMHNYLAWVYHQAVKVWMSNVTNLVRFRPSCQDKVGRNGTKLLTLLTKPSIKVPDRIWACEHLGIGEKHAQINQPFPRFLAWSHQRMFSQKAMVAFNNSDNVLCVLAAMPWEQQGIPCSLSKAVKRGKPCQKEGQGSHGGLGKLTIEAGQERTDLPKMKGKQLWWTWPAHHRREQWWICGVDSNEVAFSTETYEIMGREVSFLDGC
uniref:Uncharacterized protein n=1 Tax=Fagus sylvatica TaxID=28930 RepID=A0A2N9F8Y3_FAGSY